eukprot:6208918-Pleurochrysis_carterae.AAC.1
MNLSILNRAMELHFRLGIPAISDAYLCKRFIVSLGTAPKARLGGARGPRHARGAAADRARLGHRAAHTRLLEPQGFQV